jgi:hypothetical protein
MPVLSEARQNSNEKKRVQIQEWPIALLNKPVSVDEKGDMWRVKQLHLLTLRHSLLRTLTNR